MKFQLFLIIFLFTSPVFAQMPHIHAESVGEWQKGEVLSPEYHYNSIGVYLINENQLKTLFDPSKLSKEERKKTGVKAFDKVESLFFQLELPNPVQDNDLLSVPLYAFDLNPTNSFKSPRTQGKILDRITDEELNGRGLEAFAKIEMVSKNELLETAYKISSNINKLLGNQIFKKPDIWQVMQKAQHFFEDRYRGKMVAEFSIPILPESESYDYIIESASLYQIKWDFQEKASSYKGNVWSGLKNSPTITEAELLDRPSRLSKLKKHPYLLVVRYKSAYALPKEQQLNVALSEEYLEKRRYNLQEFKSGSIQYQTELTFTELLREALELQQEVTAYLGAKSKGKMEEATLLSIAQRYHNILTQHQQATKQLTGEGADYFQSYYETTYFKFFKQLDHLLFQDPQIKEVTQPPTTLLQWKKSKNDSLSKEALYQLLSDLHPYRQLIDSVAVDGSLPYVVKEKAQAIEEALFVTLTAALPYTQEEKLDRFQELQQEYPLCTFCKEQAHKEKERLVSRMEKELRSSLLSLQNQQLKYGRCFADLEKKASQELAKQFPTPTSLKTAEQNLYQAFLSKINSLTIVSEDFLSISTISIKDLSTQEINLQLEKYNGLMDSYRQSICHLLHGSILSKEEVQCITDACTMEVP